MTEVSIQFKHVPFMLFRDTPVENLEAKFEWLLPKENSDTLKNPKEVLLSKWPLKEVPNLFLQRLKEKIKSGIQN